MKAEDENAHQYNIEMQIQGNTRFANRSLYYWAQNDVAQLSDGDSYTKLTPVICINVLNHFGTKRPGTGSPTKIPP
ncbi:MAG: PD-(D/E)XK nuclease family transposase [Deltaproteobacteria bacterium]|nr:PD-(D/E)XK nuclease family transposase [Deltaproteobacteria bacterium]